MRFSSSLSLFSLEVNFLLFLSSLRNIFQVRNFRKSLIFKLCYAMQTRVTFNKILVDVFQSFFFAALFFSSSSQDIIRMLFLRSVKYPFNALFVRLYLSSTRVSYIIEEYSLR